MWAFYLHHRNELRLVNYSTVGLVKWLAVDGAHKSPPTNTLGAVGRLFGRSKECVRMVFWFGVSGIRPFDVLMHSLGRIPLKEIDGHFPGPNAGISIPP